MFEITSEDIRTLSDRDLRSLVGRLCESEMKRRGISPSCVTWGGDQDASDGGVDVRVALPAHIEIDGCFIPRHHTVFQTKAADTPASEILSEMCPEGIIKPAIRELANHSGAYILVSSQGSASDSALRRRREAMAEAIAGLPNAKALALDFYDRKRLESWLRDHSGTVLWVREQIGKPIPGWSAYGAWSNDPGGAKSDYLLDSELRVRTQTKGAKPNLSAADGINGLRDILRNPQGIARLVGLSGVGKTRLAQALFDARVGKNNLDAELAIYTNISDGPDPAPGALASELIKTNKRAILIVDNCPPDTHRRLSEVCRSDGSKLSLVTIEYDIQDDQAEGTDIFVLEVASITLTEHLIRRRFPQLSPLDAKRVADFSGGNARIAIAIAERIEKGDSIAALSDNELFRRLFQQRRAHDEELFNAAQALSLVYSFQGANVSEDEQAELWPLGSLIGQNPQQMFKYCAELERRGLMQCRGVWRAVLPHAIANRLAALALQNIPVSLIDKCFARAGRERLLRSFSRRLGYLSASPEARSIVSTWLGPQGMLKNPMELDDLGYAMFNYIAPVVPEMTLAALERVLLKSEEIKI